jgi:tRNA(Ile)-lysidine synthase
VFSKFAEQVRATIQKHQMLVPGDRVLAGVSGGADSVCLVLVLKELGYDVAIAHVNHSLRGAESDSDETFTAALAQQLGMKFFRRKVLLLAGNIEAGGREARKDFFAQLAREQGFTKIAVAHSRQDRIETFLLNLLRGAGPSGLISMPPVSGSTIRPLLESDRDEIEAYLEARKQPWRVDASNLDQDFARNRLRHSVLPQLLTEFNPNLLKTLSRTVEILEGEDAWTGGLAEEWLRRNGTKAEDAFVIEVEPLQGAPVALIRRVLRGALRQAGCGLQDVSFDQIESLRVLLEDGKSGKRIAIPHGTEVAREFGKLAFRQEFQPPADYEYDLKIPGSVHIRELGRIFRADIVREAENAPGERVFVDASSIGPYVRIRNWKPGDYYRPVGLPAGKLKKLFQRARIPRRHRASWPVVVTDSSIVWVASFPVSREFAPRGQSQKIVAIEAIKI